MASLKHALALSGVMRGKATYDGVIESFFGSGLGLSKPLFEFCPSLLNRVKIRRIGRR